MPRDMWNLSRRFLGFLTLCTAFLLLEVVTSKLGLDQVIKTQNQKVSSAMTVMEMKQFYASGVKGVTSVDIFNGQFKAVTPAGFVDNSNHLHLHHRITYFA